MFVLLQRKEKGERKVAAGFRPDIRTVKFSASGSKSADQTLFFPRLITMNSK